MKNLTKTFFLGKPLLAYFLQFHVCKTKTADLFIKYFFS